MPAKTRSKPAKKPVRSRVRAARAGVEPARQQAPVGVDPDDPTPTPTAATSAPGLSVEK